MDCFAAMSTAVVAGPELPGIGFPAIWEHKCLGAKGWRNIERDGIEKAYPQYAAQIWLYQAYLKVTEHPALFTATNADTCERLHLLLPFNAEQAQAWSDRAVAVIERRAPASCCRGSPMIQQTGAASCAVTAEVLAMNASGR